MLTKSFSVSPIYLFTNGYCDLYARYLVEKKLCDKVVGLFIEQNDNEQTLIHAFGFKQNRLYDILGDTDEKNVIQYMNDKLPHIIRKYNIEDIYIDNVEYDNKDKRMSRSLVAPNGYQKLGMNAMEAIDLFIQSFDFKKPDYLVTKPKLISDNQIRFN